MNFVMECTTTSAPYSMGLNKIGVATVLSTIKGTPCLCATRAGILDLQWNLICPMCRGGSKTQSLKEVASKVHCAGCNIDFTVNFEQSVELTFRPNPSIRLAESETFCIGGPQVTPHVVAQQLLAPRTSRPWRSAFRAGPKGKR